MGQREPPLFELLLIERPLFEIPHEDEDTLLPTDPLVEVDWARLLHHPLHARAMRVRDLRVAP